MSTRPRNSAHELLRICAMLVIVFYHLLSYYLYLIPHDTSLDSVLEAFLPTVHVGVILFVLISGYYTIKPSVSGLFKFLFIVFVYFVPLKFIQCIHGHSNPLNAFLFITNTPYWFIRTYLYLYLISPLLNKFLEQSNRKSQNMILLVLAIIAVYFGTMQGDESLSDGKNLINFSFLYFLGNVIREYKEQWIKVPQFYLWLAWLALNATIVCLLLCFAKETSMGSLVWRWPFPYCSPLLIVNASILFVLFSKWSISSKAINFMASSMFAVYLIHVQPTVHNHVIMPILQRFSMWYVAIMAICVLWSCVAVDKMLTPMWNVGKRIGKSLETKIEHK